jgi:hypothetical protein
MKSDAEWAQKTARTLHRENSHHWTPGLALIPKILSQAVDPAAPKAQAFIKKFNYPWTRKEIEKYRAKLPTMSEQDKKESKKVLTLPESVQKTIHLCKGLFTEELLPEIIKSEFFLDQGSRDQVANRLPLSSAKRTDAFPSSRR